MSDSLTVLFVLPWNTRTGGVATVVSGLIRHLERRGHRILALFPGASRTLEETDTDFGVRAFELDLKGPHGRNRPLRALAAFWITCPNRLIQLGRLLICENVDVVNIHYPVEGFVCLAVLRRLIGFRLILSAHGSDLLPTGNRRGGYSWAFRLLFRMADVVVTPSRALGEEVVGIMPWAEDKLRVIHNGLDPDSIHQADPQSRDFVGCVSDVPYILSIGSQIEIKGHDTLIDAFASLAANYPRLRLWLVGAGPERSRLVERARCHGISQRVIFCETWNREEIGLLLQRCEVFVVPSRREAFGLVNLEAMSCGKPVVATHVGGIPEIIDDGVSGILVPPDDPSAMARGIERFLENAALRERLADNARRRVQAFFHSDHTGEKYEKMFYTAIGAADL